MSFKGKGRRRSYPATGLIGAPRRVLEVQGRRAPSRCAEKLSATDDQHRCAEQRAEQGPREQAEYAPATLAPGSEVADWTGSRAENALARQLVARLLAGDEAAFHEFFDAHFPTLVRYTRDFLPGGDDRALELAALTLETAMRELDTYRGETSLFVWLVNITHRVLSEQPQ